MAGGWPAGAAGAGAAGRRGAAAAAGAWPCRCGVAVEQAPSASVVGDPVGFRPAAFWNASTAALVPGPNDAVGLALRDGRLVQLLLDVADGLAVEHRPPDRRRRSSPAPRRPGPAWGTRSLRISSLTTSSTGASGFCLQTLKVNCGDQLRRLPRQDVEGVAVERVEGAEIAFHPGAGQLALLLLGLAHLDEPLARQRGPGRRPGNGSARRRPRPRPRCRAARAMPRNERSPHLPVSPRTRGPSAARTPPGGSRRIGRLVVALG